MSMSKSLRQIHRWTSIVFTMCVIVTFVVLQTKNPPMWINYISLPPLFTLLLTGLYMFVAPYLSRRRG